MAAGNVERCLRELGYAIVPITGSSMLPLLREGQSQVQVSAWQGEPLKKGDIVLYRRADGALVLHRIVRVKDPDTCLLCGDHQWKTEEWVHSDQILAVAQTIFQNGRPMAENGWGYRLYRKLWCCNLTLRGCCLWLLRRSGYDNK